MTPQLYHYFNVIYTLRPEQQMYRGLPGNCQVSVYHWFMLGKCGEESLFDVGNGKTK